MKKLLFLAFVSILSYESLDSQTLYIPGGTTGIGNNTNNGNLGVNITNPKALFDVGGDISNGKLGTVFGRLPEGNSEGEGTFLGVRGFETQVGIYNLKSFALEHSFYGNINSSINFYRGGGVLGGFITISTLNNTERMRIDPYGNIGIGTTNPKNLLDVNGTIHAREVKVDLTGWSDFVFLPSYQLKPLTEVEQFIKTNGHLQDIPSAAKVEQNGVNVGEMQKKLLQKVEELTLYVIEKDKEIAEQRQINIEQQKVNREQEQLLLELKKEIENLKSKVN